MSAPSRFRKYATDCLARAQRATDATARIAWLGMAQYWLKSAEQPPERPAGQQQQQIQPKENGAKPTA